MLEYFSIKKKQNIKEILKVANIKSQKKRVLITAEEKKRNSAIRSRVRNAVKKYMALIEAKDVAGAEALLPETVSIITKARSKGVYKDL